MKGLVVWAQSSCRSVMALYRALGENLQVPVVVPVWFYKANDGDKDNRNAVGFRDDEFSDMDVIPVGENWEAGLRVLDEHEGWTHLFCNYQASRNYRNLLIEAVRRGCRVAVGSEAPCNLHPGFKGLVKEAYYLIGLPWVVRSVVERSRFFINYSGHDDRYARRIGWRPEVTIPFGYYPPPIPGTRRVLRTKNQPFEILATGELTWHRGSDVLVDALVELHRRRIPFHATITQRGPLLQQLQAKVARSNVPVDFPGFIMMEDLHRAYESCTVYVGAGRREPWGMRLNDALNCGAPLVVSRGMGGVKMVDDYGCGLAFDNNDPMGLADQLERLATDISLYKKCAENAIIAAERCSPENKARDLVEIIAARFPEWMK